MPACKQSKVNEIDQQLQLMHKMDFLPIPPLQTDHKSLKICIAAILSPLQKAFVFFLHLLSNLFLS